MTINLKQEQLINELFNKVKERFPEIIIKDLQVSPDDKDHIWINVVADMDVEREIELNDFAGTLEIDILVDYGYRLSIMSENPNTMFTYRKEAV